MKEGSSHIFLYLFDENRGQKCPLYHMYMIIAWIKRGLKAFYASLTVITHTDLWTLNCRHCHMWNRYRSWNCAKNNQLTNSAEEEVTWPSTLRLRNRLVAPGLGTDDGEEKRACVGVSVVRLAVHGSHALAKKKAWEPLMPVLTSLWLLTRMLAFWRSRSQVVNGAAGLCSWREGRGFLLHYFELHYTATYDPAF